MTKTTKYSNIRQLLIPYLAAFLLFLNMMPYFWWWTQSVKWVQYLIFSLYCVIFGLHFSLTNKKEFGLVLLFIIIVIVYSLNSTIYSIALNVPLLFIPFSQKTFTRNVYHAFCNIYCFFIGLGMISYFLILMGVFAPIRTISPLNAYNFDYYTIYPLFLANSNYFDFADIFRFAGPFDEPGMVGTFSALMLFVNSFNLKDWKTYIFIISGILSFSLFFFLIITVEILSVLLRKNGIGLVILLALVVGFSIFYNKTKEDKKFQTLIWNRLEWNTDKNALEGFDRTMYDAEVFYKSKMWTREYWWGLDDYESYRRISRGSNSYQNVIMQYGMTYLMLYVLFFILYAWHGHKNKLSFIIFIIVFIACIYQRPQILSLAYIFMFTCLARNEYFGLTSSNHKEENERILHLSNDSYL